MSETAHYATAACLALLGGVLFGVTYRSNRFDRASNVWAALKATVVWIIFVTAFILFTTAPPYPLDDVPWLVGGVVYVSIFVIAGQLWLLSTTRRAAVESWASGAELPAKVSEAGVRDWAAKHRLELGRARAPVDVTSGERTLRIEIPCRRSRRSWLLGLPTLIVSVVACLAIVAALFSVFLAGTSFPVALFAFLVGLFLSYFFGLRVLSRIVLYGALTLFGWLVLEVRDDKLTVRRRVWILRVPPFIEIRDVSGAVGSIEVDSDASDRSTIKVSWRDSHTRVTERSASFGAGYLTAGQASVVVGQLRDVVGVLG